MALVEDEEDISKVVRFVTKHDLDVAVVCGGHSHHGASTSHGVVIGMRPRVHMYCQYLAFSSKLNVHIQISGT